MKKNKTVTLHLSLVPFFEKSTVQFSTDADYQHVYDNIVYINGHTPDGTVHEMCHFVEIDEVRMSRQTWGLNFGKWHATPGNRYSNGFHEYFGTADIEREIRVIAWQINVCNALGIKHERETWQRSLDLVPGYKNLYSKGYKTDNEKNLWVSKSLDEALSQPTFSYEAFVREWWRRNAILKNETTSDKNAY